jgi:peptidoglycan/xylan/chitin deacetylase (PgdA/CDA1 family)
MDQANSKHLMVLGYHKVGPPAPGAWETWYYVSEGLFHRHLTQLQETHWQVIDLHAFLKALDEPDSLPDHAALITFDDGYRNNLLFAAPLLARFGLPGVVFVPTSYVGRENLFDHDIEPTEPICTWDELAEIESLGISVQSHGVTHRSFSSLSVDEKVEELTRSKQQIETHLNRSVDAFSFPYGDAGADAASTEALVKEAGYRAAFLYGGGINLAPFASSYKLDRIAIGADTDLLPLLEGQDE